MLTPARKTSKSSSGLFRLRLSDAPLAEIAAARGDIDVNGQRASAGDGLAIEAEASITVKGVGETAEFLLFDLP